MNNHEKLEDKIFKLVLLVLLVLALFFIVIIIVAIKQQVYTDKYLESDEYKQLIETQYKCEHNYVITSSGFGSTLKVYSKCTKCGNEFK